MTATVRRPDSLSRERLLEFAETRTDPAERDTLIDLAGHWKHGYIPLDEIAWAIKRKKAKGDGKRRRGIARGSQADLKPFHGGGSTSSRGKSRLDPKGSAEHTARSLSGGRSKHGSARPSGMSRAEEQRTRRMGDASRSAAGDMHPQEAVRAKAPDLKAAAGRGDRVAAAELKRRADKRAGGSSATPAAAPPAAPAAKLPSGYRITRDPRMGPALEHNGKVIRTTSAGNEASLVAYAHDHAKGDTSSHPMSVNDRIKAERDAVNMTHAQLAAALGSSTAGTDHHAVLRAEGEKRLRQAEHPAAPPAPAAPKAKRAPSRLYQEFYAEREAQMRRFEDSRNGSTAGQTSSKGGVTEEEQAYFGEGEHMGRGAVEKRLTFADFRKERGARNAEEKRHAQAYAAGLKLGKAHSMGKSDPSQHDAEYNQHSAGHDEEMFAGGYGDGAIAAEHVKAKRAEAAQARKDAQAAAADASRAEQARKDAEQAPKTAAYEAARRGSSEASSKALRSQTEADHKAAGSAHVKAGQAALAAGDSKSAEHHLAMAEQHGKLAHDKAGPAQGTDIGAGAPGYILSREARLNGKPTETMGTSDLNALARHPFADERKRAQAELKRRADARAAGSPARGLNDYGTRHDNPTRLTSQQTHPLGAPVTARQPGIEQVTHGVVSGHRPDGSIEVSHRDRHDNIVKGTWNPAHVTPRTGEATPEHRGRPETKAFEDAAAKSEARRFGEAANSGQRANVGQAQAAARAERTAATPPVQGEMFGGHGEHQSDLFTTSHQRELKQKLTAAPKPGEAVTHAQAREHAPFDVVNERHGGRSTVVHAGNQSVSIRASDGHVEHHPITQHVSGDRILSSYRAAPAGGSVERKAGDTTPVRLEGNDAIRIGSDGSVSRVASLQAARDARAEQTPRQIHDRLQADPSKVSMDELQRLSRLGGPFGSAANAEIGRRDDATMKAAGRDATAEHAALGNAIRGGSSVSASSPTASGIRIEHNGDGTLVHGTERGDKPTIDALKSEGFKYSSRLGAWYLPRTWQASTREQRVQSLRAKLGGKATLERGSMTPQVSPDEHQARQVENARRVAEQQTARAARLRAESDAQHAAARSISDHIPFGQPILVGHHSERRHRNDLAKIDRNMRRSIESDSAAQHAEGRARSAEARANAVTDPKAAARRLERNQAELRSIERVHGGAPSAEGQPGAHARHAQLSAQIKADQGVVGEGNGLGKHNVKPGDVVMVRGSAHVVHSTGPKNAKLMTSVGPLPYPYHQMTSPKSMDDMSTDGLKKALANSRVREGSSRGLPPAVVSRIEAILRSRGETT